MMMDPDDTPKTPQVPASPAPAPEGVAIRQRPGQVQPATNADRPPLPPFPPVSGVPSLLASVDTGPIRERVKHSWDVLFLRLENLERRDADHERQAAEDRCRIQNLERQVAELSDELRKTHK
jgi:hypothetical protein